MDKNKRNAAQNRMTPQVFGKTFESLALTNTDYVYKHCLVEGISCFIGGVSPESFFVKMFVLVHL